MGLFDFIAEKARDYGEDVQKAQMEAEHWSVSTICARLEVASSFSKISGYSKALRSKCQEMSDSMLKSTFDDVYNSRKVKSCNAMMSVMEERGLAYRDDNGKIVRAYR